MHTPDDSQDKGGDPLSGTAPRLFEQALAILAGQIGQGALPIGARLSESVIAAQFGISRAPARRALAELERLGLVEKAEGRGYRVREAEVRPKLPYAPTSLTPGSEDLRLVPQSSWERIYGEVEDEIVARISYGSWRLNEAELARHYNVSRTVARDVIGRLQQRGVIRKDERARWYAPALTPGHIDELYELRWLLEPAALVKAAGNLPQGLLPRLRASLEEAIAHAHEIGGDTLDRLEQELHVELLGHCGNRALMQAIALQQSLLIAHRFLYRWTPRLFETEPFLPEHLAIVERLEAGTPKAAAEALEDHLRVSRARAAARVAAVVEQVNPEPLSYLERLD